MAITLITITPDHSTDTVRSVKDKQADCVNVDLIPSPYYLDGRLVPQPVYGIVDTP